MAEGIPAGWQWPFTDAVINAYTCWMNVAGVDVRPQFCGFTSRLGRAGELVVHMEPHFGGGGARLASTLGSANALRIAADDLAPPRCLVLHLPWVKRLVRQLVEVFGSPQHDAVAVP